MTIIQNNHLLPKIEEDLFKTNANLREIDCRSRIINNTNYKNDDINGNDDDG